MPIHMEGLKQAALRRHAPDAQFKGEVLILVTGPGDSPCGSFLWPELELYKLRLLTAEGGGYKLSWPAQTTNRGD